MVLFFRRVLQFLLEMTEPSEIAFLKKKVAKQQKAIEELEECKRQLEADVAHLRGDLETANNTLESEREESAAGMLKWSNKCLTIDERNKALLEKQDSLELELAKANATLLVRQKEKELMVDLVKFHREQVNAAIGRTADSNANQDRPRADIQ